LKQQGSFFKVAVLWVVTPCVNVLACGDLNGSLKAYVCLQWQRIFPLSLNVWRTWIVGLLSWWSGFQIPVGAENFLFSSPHPDRLWSPPRHLSNRYQGLFHWR